MTLDSRRPLYIMFALTLVALSKTVLEYSKGGIISGRGSMIISEKCKLSLTSAELSKMSFATVSNIFAVVLLAYSVSAHSSDVHPGSLDGTETTNSSSTFPPLNLRQALIPFGPERITITQSQTNFPDMNGEVVAMVVKGSSVNHGILSTNGVGDHHKRLMLYVHADTEANSTHTDLNGKFLVGEFLYSPHLAFLLLSFYRDDLSRTMEWEDVQHSNAGSLRGEPFCIALNSSCDTSMGKEIIHRDSFCLSLSYLADPHLDFISLESLTSAYTLNSNMFGAMAASLQWDQWEHIRCSPR
ncbi:hypothetical protein ABKN59_003495 [Abortiporus biennis]